MAWSQPKARPPPASPCYHLLPVRHVPHLYIYSLPLPPPISNRYFKAIPSSILCPSLPLTIMCNSKIAQIDGRPVLQPASNRVPDPKKSMKKPIPPPISVPKSSLGHSDAKLSPLTSPKLKASPKSLLKREIDPYGLNSSSEKPPTPSSASAKPPAVVRKKFKKLGYEPAASAEAAAAGSIAAAQREQASLLQKQRKLRIAHYGRTAGKLPTKLESAVNNVEVIQEEKRCSFITCNSDSLYVAYHDEEWGVPVHDDKMLFELLVLSGFQVGLDWTTILKKRNEFRAAFAEFVAEEVAKFTEKHISSICSDYGMDLGRVRGVVDNANRILEVTKEFGSLDKFLWGFVNYKPLSPGYKSGRKIPVKNSKSEAISKDLVRRGFRIVGPTIIHSFMQAAGLTNDHLLSCPRHIHLHTINSLE